MKRLISAKVLDGPIHALLHKSHAAYEGKREKRSEKRNQMCQSVIEKGFERRL